MQRPAMETYETRHIEDAYRPALSADVYNEIKALYSAELNTTRMYYRICKAFTSDGVPVLANQVNEVFAAIHRQFSNIPTYISRFGNEEHFDAACLEHGLKVRTATSHHTTITYCSLTEDALDTLVSIGYVEMHTYTGYCTTGRGRQRWNKGVRYGHSAKLTIVRAAR